MKIKNKVLSLISSCVLITSAGKTSDACFLTFFGYVGGICTVISLADLLGSLCDKDKKDLREKLKNTIEHIVFTAGMFGLSYFTDKCFYKYIYNTLGKHICNDKK